MARAQTIWVVFQDPLPLPLGTFTVKHEMVTYLRRHPEYPVDSLRIFRYPDGGPKFLVTRIDAKELLS